MAKQRPRPSSKVPSSNSAGHANDGPAHPERSTAYFEAVALYEQGLEALQRHDYDRAASVLQSVLRQYPEEKELHERVRLYLSICARQIAPREAAPHTVDERLYAATLAINGGKYDEAISHLRLVRDEDPDNDHALYMLAVAHAQRGEHAEAIAHLERAIALNPENRAMARRDPDLEPVRDNEAFRSALDAATGLRASLGRRRPPKLRTPH
ncbi:MAG: tetratricopeptide repeat protein [Luteitalea sp.]|nr:tetratricopeptide repeat protein [Luteitalea sp.]